MEAEEIKFGQLAGKKLLSTKEFGEIVGVGKRIIQRECQNGTIKAEFVGVSFVIPASEVERYLANPRKKGPPFGGMRGRKKS